MNPRIFAIATINGVIGMGIAATIFPIVWSVDGDRNLAAARALAAGVFGQDHGYLYSPVAALFTVPAALGLPYLVAVGGWFLGRLAVLVAGIIQETRALSQPDRILVAIAGITFVPTLHDLLLGNVTILIAAAVAMTAWSDDGFVPGLLMGIVLATVPKPALIPILVWMLLYRRKAFLASIGCAVVCSTVGIIALGASAYLAWFGVLLHPAYLGTNQTGNLALGAMLPGFLAWPLTALTLVATLIALRRGEAPGFIACLCAGLLIAPYTMAYGAVLLLLAVRPLARVAPTRTFILAASGSLAVIIFLPLWVGAILVTTLAVPVAAWTNLNQGATA